MSCVIGCCACLNAMAELDPLTRRTLLLRAAALVLLYGLTSVVMGIGLFVLVQVFNGSFRYLPQPRSEPAQGEARQTPR